MPFTYEDLLNNLVNEASLGLAKKTRDKASAKSAEDIASEMSLYNASIGEVADFAFQIVKEAVAYSDIEIKRSKSSSINHWTNEKFNTYKILLKWKEYKDSSGNVFKPSMTFMLTNLLTISWQQGTYRQIPFEDNDRPKIGFLVYMNWMICTNPEQGGSFYDRKVDVIEPKQFESEDITIIKTIAENTSKLAETLDKTPGIYPHSWSKAEYAKLTQGIQNKGYNPPSASMTKPPRAIDTISTDIINKWLNSDATDDGHGNIDFIKVLRSLKLKEQWNFYVVRDIDETILEDMYGYKDEFKYLRDHDKKYLVSLYQAFKGKIVEIRRGSPFLCFQTIYGDRLEKKLEKFKLHIAIWDTRGFSRKTYSELFHDGLDSSVELLRHVQRGSEEAKKIEDMLTHFFRRNRRRTDVKAAADEICGSITESSLGLAKKTSETFIRDARDEAEEIGVFGDIKNTIKKIKIDLIDRAPNNWYLFDTQEDSREVRDDFLQFISPSFDGVPSTFPIGVITFVFCPSGEELIEIHCGGELIVFELGDSNLNKEAYDGCMSEMFNAKETFTEEDDGFEEWALQVSSEKKSYILNDITKSLIKRTIEKQ